jgi:hypothetical protein
MERAPLQTRQPDSGYIHFRVSRETARSDSLLPNFFGSECGPQSLYLSPDQRHGELAPLGQSDIWIDACCARTAD